ncbi:nucleolar protein 9-like isoform X2 [Haliotis rubra]|uniref:nucleolar protein 9-like isoform X2 n=1 Tax=Haliotis rubra TaxID=36100 RepID=UPI001EE4F4FA|nr:nucleolar protein 9-like isoform X2 [Haliotis rubra]
MNRRKPNENKSRKNKLGFLNDHTLDYYRRVFETLTDIDGEEKDLFLNNVFSQMESEAIKVSQNQTVSRFIERFLEHAKPHHIRQLLSALSEDWSTVSTDRFASHVLQNIIALSPKCVHQGGDNSDTEEEKSVKEMLLEFCEYASENLETMLTDTYASHILRVLLEVLGGVDVSTDIIRSRMSQAQAKDEKIWPKKTNPPEEYGPWFKKIFKKVFSLCDYSDHLKDASSSPVFQTILLILKQRDPESCRKYVKKILKKSGLTQPKEEEESGKEEEAEVMLPALVRNEVGAYLVQQIVAVSLGDEGEGKVYKVIFKGRLLNYAVDRAANYILQTLIDKVTDKELFEEIFDELTKYVEDILAMHHVGLLSKLASGCERNRTRQDEFVRALMEAFHCATPDSRQTALAPLLLSLSTYEVLYKPEESEDEQEEKTSPSAATPQQLTTINYHGSVLMQNLLRFRKPKLVVTSLLELKPAELKLVASDRCGSHVIDIFFESGTVGEKMKDSLLQKMKGVFLDISCDRNGSRTLESIWRNCSAQQKVVIAEELSKHADRLHSNKFGHFVYRNLAISQFQTHRKLWMSQQGVTAQKRKLFKDFFNDSGPEFPKKPRPDKSERRDKMSSQPMGQPRLFQTNQKDWTNKPGDNRKQNKKKADKPQPKVSSDDDEVGQTVREQEVTEDEDALNLLDSLVKKHGLEETEKEPKKKKKKQKQKSGEKTGHAENVVSKKMKGDNQMNV